MATDLLHDCVLLMDALRLRLAADLVLLAVEDRSASMLRVLERNGSRDVSSFMALSNSGNPNGLVVTEAWPLAVTGLDYAGPPRCALMIARQHCAYLGVPVFGINGRAVAALAATGAEPRRWDEDDRAHLYEAADALEMRLDAAAGAAGVEARLPALFRGLTPRVAH